MHRAGICVDRSLPAASTSCFRCGGREERPDGYLYEKEAILEYILHQKKEIARQMKAYEKQKKEKRTELEELSRAAEDAKLGTCQTHRLFNWLYHIGASDHKDDSQKDMADPMGYGRRRRREGSPGWHRGPAPHRDSTR
ncbi:hypothetical protein KIL84_001559 [Mauremys mutica]|uniref:Nitric oxide synthase-interacting protein n=1 Tax=Mauremys mutica TaxID=74926 RepID=A0A9D3XK66_9SAUR|nr:hypothetical protein KIL84_001559 [Mauremys mutica]